MLDQGLISGSNFVIGVLLARWLLPAQYGAYALAFSVFLLVSFLHQALLTEPQRVFGPSDYADRPREYLGAMLWIQAALGLAILLVLGTSSWLVHVLMRADALPGALAGVALAAPFILLFWLARGAFYVKLAPQYAAAGAGVYCVLVFSGLLAVYAAGLVSPFCAFLLMGLGALAASAVLLRWQRPVVKLSATLPRWRTVGAQHWRYGKWMLPSLVLSWIAGDAFYYPLLSSFSGMAAAGELRALMNLSLPVAHFFGALSLFFVPYASRIVHEEGVTGLKSLTWRISCLFGAGAVGYWTLMLLLGKMVLHSLYGGHYTELAPLIPWLAAGSLPWHLAAVPAIALRAVRSSASLFSTYCVSSAVAILVGVPATSGFGLRGALLTMILSNSAALVVVVALVNSKLRNA